MPRTAALLVAAALVVGGFALVFGCAPKAASPAASAPAAAADLKLMGQQQKWTMIAPNFPPQVPVPDGSVVSAKAQGDSAWDYRLVLQGSVPAVAQWFREAYARAEWTLVADTGTVLTFRKNNAQSQIKLEPYAQVSDEAVSSATPTLATVTLGVGADILNTQ